MVGLRERQWTIIQILGVFLRIGIFLMGVVKDSYRQKRSLLFYFYELMK